MMKYAIVYSSRTGNTRQLADALHSALPAGDCLYFGAPAPEARRQGGLPLRHRRVRRLPCLF